MTFVQKLKRLIDRVVHLGGYGCTDIQQLLFEYVEGDLTGEMHQKLEKHLADCPGCVRYVSSYRQTIEATRKHGCPEVELPAELQSRLREFIRQNPELR